MTVRAVYGHGRGQCWVEDRGAAGHREDSAIFVVAMNTTTIAGMTMGALADATCRVAATLASRVLRCSGM